MPPCRVLVVDDSPVFLRAAAEFAADIPGVRVVGRAVSGPEALELVAQLSPDAVLTDLRMPGPSGLDLARILSAWACRPRVAIMSIDDQRVYHEAAREAGAVFLSKDDLIAGLPGFLIGS